MSKRLNLSRINADLQDMASGDIPETILDVEINDDNILGPHYIKINGPPDTPYQNGIFKMELIVSQTYPFQPPHLKFLTKMYHPNISQYDGSICIDILKDQWSAALKLKSIILSISSLLENPNPRDPLEPYIADIYMTDKKQFNENVIKHVKKYSLKEDKNKPEENLGENTQQNINDVDD